MSIASLRLSGLLSFAPDSPPFELQKLNVLIGPNGSGKSNLIEAIEVLAATPRDLAKTIRDGGGPSVAIYMKGGGDSVGSQRALRQDGSSLAVWSRPALYGTSCGYVRGRSA